MDSTTPQTPYDLDTRLNTVNELARTALGHGRKDDADRLFNLAIRLLDIEDKAEPSEVKEEQKKPEYVSKFVYPPCGPDCLICFPVLPPVKGPDVCADPGCGICHPWNKEVE